MQILKKRDKNKINIWLNGVTNITIFLYFVKPVKPLNCQVFILQYIYASNLFVCGVIELNGILHNFCIGIQYTQAQGLLHV